MVEEMCPPAVIFNPKGSLLYSAENKPINCERPGHFLLKSQVQNRTSWSWPPMGMMTGNGARRVKGEWHTCGAPPVVYTLQLIARHSRDRSLEQVEPLQYRKQKHQSLAEQQRGQTRKAVSMIVSRRPT